MSRRAAEVGAPHRSVEAVTTVSSLALVLAAVSLALAAGHAGQHRAAAPGPESVVVALCIVVILTIGLLNASLACQRRRAEARDARVASALERVHRVHGLSRTVQAALRELRGACAAREVLVAVSQADSGKAYVWTASQRDGPAPHARRSVPDEAALRDYAFEDRCKAWYARLGRNGCWRVLGFDEHGRTLRGGEAVPIASLEKLALRHECSSLACIRTHAEDWTALVFVLEPVVLRPAEETLLLLQCLVGELAGVAGERFQVGRLRARVSAAERARLARELHDGTIQSLVGVEMELDVLRRRAESCDSALAPDLARAQALLRDEVIELRDTMSRLKPIDVQPDQLVAFLDGAVARFARESGIRACFECPAPDVDVPPPVGRELVRIVAEALQNVRRHSGASRARVRLQRGASGGWDLLVEDDGCGFAEVDGTWDMARLDRAGRGPFTIKERVRSLAGTLSIGRLPQGGARLDVHIPAWEP